MCTTKPQLPIRVLTWGGAQSRPPDEAPAGAPRPDPGAAARHHLHKTFERNGPRVMLRVLWQLTAKDILPRLDPGSAQAFYAMDRECVAIHALALTVVRLATPADAAVQQHGAAPGADAVPRPWRRRRPDHLSHDQSRCRGDDSTMEGKLFCYMPGSTVRYRAVGDEASQAGDQCRSPLYVRPTL